EWKAMAEAQKGTGQQPAQLETRCLRCSGFKLYDGKTCDVCNGTGRRPTQPESGEARHPAIENLRNCQRQLDMDGCEVGVSRQAVDETLAEIDRLQSSLTAAQQESQSRERAWREAQGELIDRLTAAQQQIALHKADAANAIARTDEIGRRLIAAQQREAE